MKISHGSKLGSQTQCSYNKKSLCFLERKEPYFHEGYATKINSEFIVILTSERATVLQTIMIVIGRDDFDFGSPCESRTHCASRNINISNYDNYTASQHKLYYFKSKLDGENTLVH